KPGGMSNLIGLHRTTDLRRQKEAGPYAGAWQRATLGSGEAVLRPRRGAGRSWGRGGQLGRALFARWLPVARSAAAGQSPPRSVRQKTVPDGHNVLPTW